MVRYLFALALLLLPLAAEGAELRWAQLGDVISIPCTGQLETAYGGSFGQYVYVKQALAVVATVDSAGQPIATALDVWGTPEWRQALFFIVNEPWPGGRFQRHMTFTPDWITMAPNERVAVTGQCFLPGGRIDVFLTVWYGFGP